MLINKIKMDAKEESYLVGLPNIISRNCIKN